MATNSIGIRLALVLALAAVAVLAQSYTDKYDNIDVDAILSNERLYLKYKECLTNKGTCSPDARQLKALLPDALETGCSKCTQKQREGFGKVIKFLTEKKPDDLAELEKLYDPKGEFRKKYAGEAEKHGIKL